MKKVVLLLFVLACIGQELVAQLPLNKVRRAGWTVRVYRIPADTAQRYLIKGFRVIDRYIKETPVAVFHRDSIDYESLPLGNYLAITADDSLLTASLYCHTHIESYVVNNERSPQLFFRHRDGAAIANAQVTVDGKAIGYAEKSGTYVIKKRKLDEALVRITTPGDTSFIDLDVDREVYRSPGQQRWTRFKLTPVGKAITWLPRKVQYMIENPARYWFRKRNNKRANGYMLFSKPKYFPSDTIRFKAYIVNKKGRPYKNELEARLEYQGKTGAVRQPLVTLKPQPAGAFIYDFNTGDTLPNDTRYTVGFYTKKNRRIFSGQFKIEDYLLDEVASYTLTADRERYSVVDTMRFTASAKDANGLPLMDGKVTLYLLNHAISKVYPEREFVADTLWKEEKILAIEGDTRFELPASLLPQADMEIDAKAVFSNSNNELQEQTERIIFSSARNYISVIQDRGSLRATWFENGKPVTKSGWMETDLNENRKEIVFPYSTKIDPYVSYYDFYIKNEKGQPDFYKSFDIENTRHVRLSPAQYVDTAGFVLQNDHALPVFYTIFDNNKEVFRSVSSDPVIVWKDKMAAGKLYTVKWQYYWAGEEKKDNSNFGLAHKYLNTEIGGASTIYPGQKDTITIKVKDYKNREAGGVNLSAVSYNSQFGADIKMPSPPYLDKFRGRRPVEFNSLVSDPSWRKEQMLLGKHPGWILPLGLDTMTYYQFLFPKGDRYMVRSRVETVLPQVAVYAVKQGSPQEIFLLYINRQLVYYNGTNAQMPYSNAVFPGNAQIAIRTKDKYIEFDSIYLQPYYKHDIVFDLDRLSATAKVEERPRYWTFDERSMLEHQVMRLEGHHRHSQGYLWQGTRVALLTNNYSQHIVGPFIPGDSIQFFKPGDFDFKFLFEGGYRYRVSPQVVRLEKIRLFTGEKVYLSYGPDAIRWRLGDTLKPPPAIHYNKLTEPMLEAHGINSYLTKPGYSRIRLTFPKDTSIAFTILHQDSIAKPYRVLWTGVQNLHDVEPGVYHVVVVTHDFKFAEARDIVVTKAGAYCVSFEKARFTRKNDFFDLVVAEQSEKRKRVMEAERLSWSKEQVAERAYNGPRLNLPVGTATISGFVKDEKGAEPIPFATVAVIGYTGMQANADGSFVFSKIRAGKYVLRVSALGYTSRDIEADVEENSSFNTTITLTAATANLQEVVVVGYGTQKRMSLTGSVAGLRSDDMNASAMLMRLPGVHLDTVKTPDATTIRIRGAASIPGDKVLYVIDGVPMDEMPSDLDPADINDTQILKDAAAVTLYGSRAANGVIVITTKGFAPKTLRENFRDYAFWQPNLVTDDNGEAKFTVTYPDNVTSWQTWVVGMDKKRRITQASKMVKSFKPLLAQLSGPQFLIAGDSVTFIGKKINYTQSAVDVAVQFSINGKELYNTRETVAANNSSVSELPVLAGSDSIKAQFGISASGFADGELRQIPVLRRGTTETLGQFYILQKDTTINFHADPLAGSIMVYAQNNTLDVLLSEIEHLKKYPYYCMEQTASKITGLAMEKKIREALNQPFKNEKELQQLISKLQKGQLFEGGWSWWQNGPANLAITNYVTRALLQLRGNTLLEFNIRNALLYLHNNLSVQSRYNQLQTLYTLSQAGHEMDYYMYLRKLPFDSLTQHQQWQVVSILQQQKMDYREQLEKLMRKKTNTVLGGVHWGEDSYYWESNTIATTVIAFDVLKKDSTYPQETRGIVQYFLESRRNGYWRNTVESATILSTIIPQVLDDNKNFTQPASINISGDTSFVINHFPYSGRMNGNKQDLTIRKEGGGMVYFTAHQELFNPAPQAVDSLYQVSSRFETTGRPVQVLKAGEKVTLKVKINARKEGEYIQITIPIPAGCTYASKSQYGGYREYYKDRVMLFVEKLKKGEHEYEIELEPRYTGRYTINPVKVELMYFPTFYGRDGMKAVRISK